MSIKINLFYNSIYQLLLISLPLLTAPYISRVLGPEGIGTYSYTFSIAQYFMLLGMLGINNYGSRSIASCKDDVKQRSKTFLGLYLIQLITTTLFFLIYVFVSYFYILDNRNIVFLQFFFVVASILDINWFFFGIEEFKLTIIRSVIIKLIAVACIFLFVKTANDLWKYTLIMSLSVLINQMILWFYLKRFINFEKVKFVDSKKHLKPLLILFVPILSYSLYKIMAKIILGSLTDMQQVGFYESAEKVVNIPMGLVTALGTVMLPRLTNLISNGETVKALSYLNKSTLVVTFLASAICFGLIGISPVFTPLFFGEGYSEVSNLLSYLSISVFFIAWANVLRTQYLIPFQLDSIYVKSMVIGAIVSICLNFLLIAKFKAIGAIFSTVLAEFSVMATQFIFISKKINLFKNVVSSFPYIFIGVSMSIFLRLLIYFQNDISLFLLLIFGAFFYIIFCTIYITIKKDFLFETLEVYIKLITKKWRK